MSNPTDSFCCPERMVSGIDFWHTGTGNWCTYCGSMNPDDFMQAVRDGDTLTPTDKTYKVYITLPGQGTKKFYFKHLNVQQKIEFIELYNQRKLVVERNFYTLPYFMTFASCPETV